MLIQNSAYERNASGARKKVWKDSLWVFCFVSWFIFFYFLHYYYYSCLNYCVWFRFVWLSVFISVVVNQILVHFLSNKMYKGFVRFLFILFLLLALLHCRICLCAQTNEYFSLFSNGLIRLQFFHWKAHKYKEASKWNATCNENIQTEESAHVNCTPGWIYKSQNCVKDTSKPKNMANEWPTYSVTVEHCSVCCARKSPK